LLGCLVIVSITIIVVVAIRRKRRSQLPLYQLTLLPPNRHSMILDSKRTSINEPGKLEELPNLVIERKLGSGNFGEVFYGKVDGTPCACKRVTNVGDLEREANTLAQLSHPNIVLLMGIHTSNTGEKYMVFEYVSGGNLLDFLQQNEHNLDIIDLLKMVIGAARGMVYLERKQIVHRDLAARNILIDEKKQVKVGDFGMSRGNMYQSSDVQIPIRWAAPEVIRQSPVTTKSDVYSFGIVLWEIFEFGTLPFADLSNNDVIRLTTEKNSKKLPQPPNCPIRLYNLMTRCWNFFPEDRPSFKDVLVELESIKEEIRPDQSDQVIMKAKVEAETEYANIITNVMT